MVVRKLAPFSKFLVIAVAFQMLAISNPLQLLASPKENDKCWVLIKNVCYEGKIIISHSSDPAKNLKLQCHQEKVFGGDEIKFSYTFYTEQKGCKDTATCNSK